VVNEIVKYSFFQGLARDFECRNPCNCASLYILKHAIVQLHFLKSQFEMKVNCLDVPEWNAFCKGVELKMCEEILTKVKKGCEEGFSRSFSKVVPAVEKTEGTEAAKGLMKILGKNILDPIDPGVICYELEHSWITWTSQNKSP
jgi:hypothetical protein